MSVEYIFSIAGVFTVAQMAIFNGYVSLPEAKPPFSYGFSHGFPMIIPLKSPFLIGKPSISLRAMAKSHGYLRTPDLPRSCHFVAVAFTRLHGPRLLQMRHVELLQSLGFMVDTR